MTEEQGKDMENRLKKLTKNHQMQKYILAAAFFFPILICSMGFAIMGVFPFGSRSDLIIDGVHQYLGFYEKNEIRMKKGTGTIQADRDRMGLKICMEFPGNKENQD